MNAKLQLFLTDKGNFSNMRENEFVNDMKCNARKLGVSYGDSELQSWGENFKAMKEVLNDCKIPNDVYIGFEYLVPVGGRIDCVLFGCDGNKGKNMLHIELKQWSKNMFYSCRLSRIIMQPLQCRTMARTTTIMSMARLLLQ